MLCPVRTCWHKVSVRLYQLINEHFLLILIMSSMNISIRTLMLMSEPSSQAHKLLIPSQVRTGFSVLMISAVIFFLPSFLHLLCLCLFTGTGGPWYLAVLPHHSKKPGKLIFVNCCITLSYSEVRIALLNIPWQCSSYAGIF